MDRNEVSLTLVSVRIVLRPLYISKANLFWSLIKSSLHSLAACAYSRTITSCKAALNWISNLFLVRCGENGLFLPLVSQLVSHFSQNYLFHFWSFTFLSAKVRLHSSFLRPSKTGREEKRTNTMTSFSLIFFSSHYFLLVLPPK